LKSCKKQKNKTKKVKKEKVKKYDVLEDIKQMALTKKTPAVWGCVF